MIDVRELRVGNYVNDSKAPNVFAEIHTICRYDLPVKLTDKDGYLYEGSIRDLHAIPLTEEILLKCGLERNTITNHFVIQYGRNGNPSPDRNIYLGYELNIGWYVGIQDKTLDSVIINTVKYLHELQNLYKCLSNQELTINL